MRSVAYDICTVCICKMQLKVLISDYYNKSSMLFVLIRRISADDSTHFQEKYHYLVVSKNHFCYGTEHRVATAISAVKHRNPVRDVL